MTFLRLKNDRLRISLTKEETEKLFGRNDILDPNDPKAKTALKLLFKKAVRDNVLKPERYSGVWVEVVKNLSGGYDVYFTKSGLNISSGSLVNNCTLQFLNCADAIKASKILALSSAVRKSSFYRFYDKYRMLVELENGAFAPAEEFAEKVFTDTFIAEQTLEHGRELIKHNAIEILAKL